MKTLFLNTRAKLFFATTVLLFGFFSCTKDNTGSTTQTMLQQGDPTKLSDSCSYTLEGVTYTCDVLTGQGGANTGANLDTSNGGWNWDADTLQYRKSYNYGFRQSFRGIGGSLTIHFVKKFAKRELTRLLAPGIFGPVSDTLLYPSTGEYPFTVDWNRFNRQNGIVLELGSGNGGNVTQIMGSYSSQSARWSTSITNDSQKDSKFEITNIFYIPEYKGWLNCHLIEARFSVNIFDGNEKPHRVNGYIRIHVD